MGVAVRQSARQFVKAAAREVPVDTGQARGTFGPIAKKLRVRLSIPLAGPKPGKNRTTGAAFGRKPPYVTVTDKVITFRFSNTLDYYNFNDLFPRGYGPDKQSTPWKSFQAGKDAYNTELRKQIKKKLPGVISQILRGGVSGN